MRNIMMVFLVAILFGTSVAQSYEKTLVDIRNAFDTKTHKALYDRYLKEYKKNPNRYTGFAYGSMQLQMHRLSYGIKEVVFDESEARKALKRSVRDEKESGYPLAMYAWFVDHYREPDLPRKPVKVTYTYIKGPDGKIIDDRVPVYDETLPDPSLNKRKMVYIEEALRIDPTNPMALYLKNATAWKSVRGDTTAVANMAKLLDIARGTLWEVEMLNKLYYAREFGNKEVPAGFDTYFAEMYEKSKHGAFGKVIPSLARFKEKKGRIKG